LESLSSAEAFFRNVSLIFDYDRCHIEILLNNYETHKMIMAAGNYNADNGSFSGELIVLPEEDINTNQEHISGERFPDNILELCDKCHWCCTCFNTRNKEDL
jgi:hypothetical protein